MFLVIKKLKIQKKFFSLFLVFFIIVFLSIIFSAQSTESLKTVALGDKNAKITVKVFSSLTCPHCASFHKKIFDKLKKEFIETNIVRFEHHGFPLDLAALNAEKLLRCSNDSEKRLNFLDEIYEKQDSWAAGEDINSINSKLTKIARNYDLNDDKISHCLGNENLENQILEGRINGSKKYSIQSTPTIFINEKEYDGEHNYESFRKTIKKFL